MSDILRIYLALLKMSVGALKHLVDLYNEGQIKNENLILALRIIEELGDD